MVHLQFPGLIVKISGPVPFGKTDSALLNNFEACYEQCVDAERSFPWIRFTDISKVICNDRRMTRRLITANGFTEYGKQYLRAQCSSVGLVVV